MTIKNNLAKKYFVFIVTLLVVLQILLFKTMPIVVTLLLLDYHQFNLGLI